jgi:prepilin-type N-terminal cleavage/methylation domain-containing protein
MPPAGAVLADRCKQQRGCTTGVSLLSLAHRRSGFSLIEVVVAMGIIAALAATAIPSIQEMIEKRRIQGFARDAANMFQIARSQAIRTGNYNIVFFGPPGTVDPASNPIEDAGGTSVPILILDDGAPATANCHIDGGEPIETLAAEADVGWGVALASIKVPADEGGATFSPPQSSGTTYSFPGATARNWVLFRPDGVPVGIAPTATTCGTIGEIGTGGAGLYFTSNSRDYAVTISPVGSVRVHAWNGTAWSL